MGYWRKRGIVIKGHCGFGRHVVQGIQGLIVGLRGSWGIKTCFAVMGVNELQQGHV